MSYQRDILQTHSLLLCPSVLIFFDEYLALWIPVILSKQNTNYMMKSGQILHKDIYNSNSVEISVQ